MQYTVLLYGPKSRRRPGVARKIRQFEIDGSTAYLSSFNPEKFHLAPYSTDAELELMLKKKLADKVEGVFDWKMVRTMFSAGICHPRIYRPAYSSLGDSGMSSFSLNKPAFENVVASDAVFQLSSLTSELTQIFQFVQPSSENMTAYGYKIRNLLILASTEFEAQCRGVLNANAYPSARRWGTKDYVKLASIMRLGSYSIQFAPHIDLNVLQPLRDWTNQYPTQSLPWYEAYNATKHDRENGFKLANLEHCINAIAACVIMLVAQYGVNTITGTAVEYFYTVQAKPKWSPYNSYLNLRYDSQGLEPVSYSF